MFKPLDFIHQMVLAFPDLLSKSSFGQIVLDFVDVFRQFSPLFSDLLLQSRTRELVLELADLSNQIVFALANIWAEPST